jgi:hypothetical protein
MTNFHNTNNNGTPTGTGTAFNFFSLRSWITCCTVEAYAPYFDVDTEDVVGRLKSSLFQFYKPDHFRTSLVGDVPTETLKGPDLYGPVWIVMTLIFVLAVTSNIYHFWEHAKQKRAADDTTQLETFEVDIYHLLHASNVVLVFVFGVSTAMWLSASCIGLAGASWALWVCVYGYSQTPILLAAPLIVIFPLHILTWLLLATSVSASGMLVIRNMATPLMAQDTAAGNAKAGPIILSILACHFVYFAVLKYVFFP